MKTKYIIFSIVLVALTTTSFAQLSSIKERLVNRKHHHVEIRHADYSTGNGSVERWMHGIQDWANERFTRDIYEGPVITRTICSDQVEIIYDQELNLENWMETPFESIFTEEALLMENWMAAPFENSLAEQTLSLEGWMAAPFDKGLPEEILTLESWMSVPFENNLVDEVMTLEEWMKAPFESGLAEELLQLESWMTSAWI